MLNPTSLWMGATWMAAMVAVVAVMSCGGGSARPPARPGEVVTIVGGGEKDSFIGLAVAPDGTAFVGLVGKHDIVRAFERGGGRRDVYRDGTQFNALAWDPSRKRLFGAQSTAGDGVWEVVKRSELRMVMGGPKDALALANPGAVVVDSLRANLYIADTGHQRVLAVPQAEGTPIELTAFRDLRGPTGLAFDTADKVLYVADGGRVWRAGPEGPPTLVAGTGEYGFGGDGGPAIEAQLGGRVGLAFDPKRRILWIADTGNHRLRCVNPAGLINTVAGTGEETDIPPRRGPARETAVPYPREVGVDSAGNVYVVGDAFASIPRVVQMLATPDC